MDLNVWTNLGSPPPTDESSKKSGEHKLVWHEIRLSEDQQQQQQQKRRTHFVGLISRVNMWNRVLDYDSELAPLGQQHSTAVCRSPVCNFHIFLLLLDILKC